jgi:hypothetical protein
MLSAGAVMGKKYVPLPNEEASEPIIVHNTELGRRLAAVAVEATRAARAGQEKQ